MSRKSRNEFRFNYNTNHPNYVFYEDNGRYRSVGLTHHKDYITKKYGKFKNMPLSKNPNLYDDEDAYVRYGIISAKKNYYGKVLSDYIFSDSDFKNVKSKIRNYKNYKRKKKNK